jgi:creatinine amidohydrolase
VKDCVDLNGLARVDAGRKRERLGDGCCHGLYERPDTDMLAIWEIAVEETRAQLENDWH